MFFLSGFSPTLLITLFAVLAQLFFFSMAFSTETSKAIAKIFPFIASTKEISTNKHVNLENEKSSFNFQFLQNSSIIKNQTDSNNSKENSRANNTYSDSQDNSIKTLLSLYEDKNGSNNLVHHIIGLKPSYTPLFIGNSPPLYT